MPPFDGKPTDVFGGQHLKTLSAESGALSRVDCCVSNIPHEWDETRKSGEERSPQHQLFFKINRLLH